MARKRKRNKKRTTQGEPEMVEGKTQSLLETAKEVVNTATTTITIKDKAKYKSLGILLMNDEDIKAIKKNSGTHAHANEYQVHYWFLLGRFTFADGSILDVGIPTVYFNYEQEVSTASVKFDLSKVDEVSNALLPVHNMKVNELLAFKDSFPAFKENVEFEWMGVNLGTIHRHPGALTSFSGTDLDKNASNPGIVYPFGEVDIENKPSFSSIIIHKNTNAVIGHTEYRIANQNDKTIEYNEHRCITYVKGPEPEALTIAEQVMGEEPSRDSYTTMVKAKQSAPIIQNIMKWFDDIEYSASTEFIDESNVTTSYSAQSWNGRYGNHYSYGGNNYNKTKTNVGNGNHNLNSTQKKADIREAQDDEQEELPGLGGVIDRSGFSFPVGTPQYDIPARTSEEYKRVATMLETMYGIKLYDRTRIANMPLQLQQSYGVELEEHHLANPSEKHLSVQDIINLQDAIWYEMQKEMEGTLLDNQIMD